MNQEIFRVVTLFSRQVKRMQLTCEKSKTVVKGSSLTASGLFPIVNYVQDRNLKLKANYHAKED